jgi:hypothetical protein
VYYSRSVLPESAVDLFVEYMMEEQFLEENKRETVGQKLVSKYYMHGV